MQLHPTEQEIEQHHQLLDCLISYQTLLSLPANTGSGTGTGTGTGTNASSLLADSVEHPLLEQVTEGQVVRLVVVEEGGQGSEPYWFSLGMG